MNRRAETGHPTETAQSERIDRLRTPAEDGIWDRSIVGLHIRAWLPIRGDANSRPWPRLEFSESLVLHVAEWAYVLLGFITPSSLWTFYRVKRFKHAVRRGERDDTPRALERLQLIALDQYLFAQLAVQVSLLVVAANWSVLAPWAAGLAFLRIGEIICLLLRIILVDTRSDTPLASTGLPPYDIRRVVRLAVSIPLYFVQTALAFATIAAALLVAQPGALKDGGQTLTGGWALLYFSWTTLTTLGNSFAPQTPLAMALVVAMTSVGVLILAFAVGICVGSLRLIFPTETGPLVSRGRDAADDTAPEDGGPGEPRPG